MRSQLGRQRAKGANWNMRPSPGSAGRFVTGALAVLLAIYCIPRSACQSTDRALFSEAQYLGEVSSGPSDVHTFTHIRLRSATTLQHADSSRWDNQLTVATDQIMFEMTDGTKIAIADTSVSQLTYGAPQAHMGTGVAMALACGICSLAVAGRSDHVIGIRYRPPQTSSDQVLVIEADKHTYLPVLYALKGATGVPLAVDKKYLKNRELLPLLSSQPGSTPPSPTTVSLSDPILQLQNRFSGVPPLGVYALESNFNILDEAYFDPATAQVTLLGHYDKRYAGPQIPYLEHLAVLLENSRPEFTLDWTPETDREVSSLLRRLDSLDERRRAVDEWTKFFDSQHHVTEVGSYMLESLGIYPTKTGGPPGYLGLQMAPGPRSLTIRITGVAPRFFRGASEPATRTIDHLRTFCSCGVSNRRRTQHTFYRRGGALPDLRRRPRGLLQPYLRRRFRRSLDRYDQSGHCCWPVARRRERRGGERC